MGEMTPSDGGTCLRCGYDLTGLDGRVGCPECGLLAGLSRLPADELRHHRPRWLRTVQVGLVLCALAVPAVLLPEAGGRVGLRLWEARYGEFWNGVGTLPSTYLAVGQAVGSTAWLLILAAGLWLATARGREVGHPARRWFLRLSPMLPAIGLGLTILMVARRFDGQTVMVAALLPWLGFALVFWLGLDHLAAIARAAPAPLLAGDAPVLGRLTTLLTGSFFTFAVWATAFARFDDQGPGNLLLIAIGVFAAVLLTCLAWTVYLLTRGAVALGTPIRQAQELWTEGDFSATQR